MNKELEIAAHEVEKAVSNMEKDLAKHGMTLDDWLEAQKKRNEELRKETAERKAANKEE